MSKLVFSKISTSNSTMEGVKDEPFSEDEEARSRDRSPRRAGRRRVLPEVAPAASSSGPMLALTAGNEATAAATPTGPVFNSFVPSSGAARHNVDMDNTITDEILELLGDSKPDTKDKKAIAAETDALFKNVIRFDKTESNTAKMKAIKTAYADHTIPAAAPRFGVAYETPAYEEPFCKEATAWTFKHGEIMITVNMDADSSFRQVKEATHFFKHALSSHVDYEIGCKHAKQLRSIIGFEKFRKECLGSTCKDNKDGLLDKIDLGRAKEMWDRETNLTEATILMFYKRVVEKARKSIAEAKATEERLRTSRDKLVEHPLKSDPMTFITKQVELVISRKLGKKKSEAFNVDYLGLAKLVQNESYTSADVSQKVEMIKSMITPAKKSNNEESLAVRARDNKAKGKGKGKDKKGKGKGKSKQKMLNGEKRLIAPPEWSAAPPKDKGKGKGKGKNKTQKGGGKGGKGKSTGKNAKC